MDFNFPFPKRPTVCFRVNNASGVDRISALPDEVLRHILSFLTMKQAVATSMLSKRWEGLWTSIPNLEFNDESPPQGVINYSDYESVFRTFKDFVERILFYHDGREMQKCHFVCCSTIGTSNLYAWICAVIASNVQELIVGTAFFNIHQLPWTVFTCKTLRSLKLQGVTVLNLPTSISLPSLKTLSLSKVVYVDDASLQRLFSSCPVLEELSITRMDWDGVCIMNVSAPSLKRLFLHNMMPDFRGEPDQKIVIDSPMLDFLEVKDSTEVNYYSSKFSSSLVKVYIHGVSSYGLLRAISPVKHLALFASAIKNLHPYVPDWGIPVLPNLTKMELHVGLYIKWDLLPHLLESAPNLEVLFFPEGLVVPKWDGRRFRDFSWLRPEHVPECLLLHLKTIEIHKFVGKPGELRLIEYLLECSNVLERMIIRGHNCTGNPTMQKELEQLQDEISRFPRAHPTCELIF